MLFTCLVSSGVAVLGLLCLTGRLDGFNSLTGSELASLGRLATVGGLAVVCVIRAGVSRRFIPVKIYDSSYHIK